jgi:hypothetical protein
LIEEVKVKNTWMKYGYLNSEGEYAQTMLCPWYEDRALLIGKSEAVGMGCASTGIGR